MRRYCIFLLLISLLVSSCNLSQLQIQPPASDAVASMELQLLGHVGGSALSIAVQGDYAFLGLSYEFIVLDIQDRAHPRWISALPIPTTDIVLADPYAYIVGRGGFAIIDISNPTQPLLLSTLALAETPAALAVTTDYAYVSSFGDLLHIAIADPAHPYLVGVTHLATRITGIAATAQAVYVVTNEGFHWLEINDADQLTVLGLFENKMLTSGPVIAGRYVYFGGRESLFIHDIAAMAAPYTPLQLPATSWIADLAVVDEIAYLAGGLQGLRVWDITDQTRPVELASYPTNGITTYIVADAGYVYVVDCDTGLQIFDTTDPNNLALVGNFTPLGITQRLVVAGGFAYLVAGYNGELHQLAVTPPDQVHTANTHLTQAPVHSIALAGDYLYFVFDGGVGGIDLAVPAALQQPTVLYRSLGLWGIAVADDYLYVSDYRGNLWLLDITDPVTPVDVAYYPLLGYTGQMAMDGKLIYLPYTDVGMRIFSVDGDTLTLIGIYPTPLPINKIAVANGYAFLALGQRGLDIVDVTDPTHPRLLHRYNTPGNLRDVAVQWPYLILADGESGVRVLDVTDPAQPLVVATYATSDCVDQVVSANGLIYAAQPLGGLLILTLIPSP